MKHQPRLDEYLLAQQLVESRQQALDLIKSGQIKVNGVCIKKPSFRLDLTAKPRLQRLDTTAYASRSGHKLAGAASTLAVQFANKVVLDVGAHRGGFTSYALAQNAQLVIAVDVGRQPLAPALAQHSQIISFNRTDIRTFKYPARVALPDIILVDVSFISLLKIIDHLRPFCQPTTQVLVLAKPQFETDKSQLQKGLVKNDTQRRAILRQLESQLQQRQWVVVGKADSKLPGRYGNLERFYLLRDGQPV